MGKRLVELDEILETLRDRGPLPSVDLARVLGLTRLDARIVLLDARFRGLVSADERRAWALTGAGLAATAAGNRANRKRRRLR